MQDYCSNLLRRHDHNFYLSSLFIPKEFRSSVWALGAFNAELSLINSRDLKIAKLKHQFWIDALPGILENKPIKHPVAQALALANSKRPISQLFLKRLITAREKQLTWNFSNLEDLESYSESTNSTLFYLILSSLGIQSLQVDHAVSHLGKTMGIITALRATPILLKDCKCNLPLDLFAKYQLSTQELYRFYNQRNSKLEELVFELGTRANDHLITSLKFEKEWPRESFPVLLNYVPAFDFLQKLQEHNFNLFHSRLFYKSWKLPFKLLYYARKKSLPRL